MMASLLTANDRNGYFMTDRSTYIVAQKKHPELNLGILGEGELILVNHYHVLTGNPEVHPKMNYETARVRRQAGHTCSRRVVFVCIRGCPLSARVH